MTKQIRRRYWLIADTHFNHEKIHDFCDRPVGFEETILKNMKECIREDDILIHLGDVSWRDDGNWHDRIMEIPCFKRWLVKGNHDTKTQSWYLDRGWDFVGKSLSLNMFNKRVIFSHKPLISITANNTDFDYNIHGHFHNMIHRVAKYEPEIARKLNNKHILIKLEHHYKPLNLEKVLADIKSDYSTDYYTFNKVFKEQENGS